MFTKLILVLLFASPLPQSRETAQSRPAEKAQSAATATSAYIIPAGHPQTAALSAEARKLGATLETLREERELDVEFAVPPATRPEASGNGSAAPREVRREARRVSAGGIVVRPATQRAEELARLFDSPDGEAVLRLPSETDLLAARLPQEAANRPRRPITFDTIYGRRRANLSGSPVTGLTWLADGEHYLQSRRGTLQKVHALSGRMSPFLELGPLQQALAALPAIGKQAAEDLARQARSRMSPDRAASLMTHADDLFFATFDGDTACRLTETPGREEFPTFSPDGRWVAFVRDYDVHAVDIASQRERPLTTGGSSLLRHGHADWVYYEEIFNRQWQAYAWSPDSSRIVFLEFDDEPVAEFSVVNPIPPRQSLERERYPKAGDANPRVRVGVATVDGDDKGDDDGDGVQWIELDYPADDMLISRFGWLPDGKSVYLYVQDRRQRWLDFVVADVSTGNANGTSSVLPARRLFRDQTPAWIEALSPPSFLQDGTFLIASPRDGWNHLHHYAADGTLLAQVTRGEWEVRDLEHVDEKQGWLYFTATRDSPIAANLYRVRLDGSELTRLTPAAGSHQVSLSPSGKLFIDTSSSHRGPAIVELRNVDGSLARVIDSNPVPELADYAFGTTELLQIPMKDGFLLEASLVKPPDFDRARKYPVWLMTYGGPHMPSVADSWQGGRGLDHMLANLGIIVFRCDPRSASGKGAASAWTAYRQLGVQELKDIEEALDWLTSRPYIDAARIGMSGHSYGGFLTAYAMTHCKRFCAGIAGGPVTDWRNYDTIYTERYMGTPQENADGYRRSSVVAAAKDLHGRLLLLHGGMDDNVHVQNTLQLVEALQAADKDFELMIYPRSRHGLGGPHYQRLVVEFIRRNLKP